MPLLRIDGKLIDTKAELRDLDALDCEDDLYLFLQKAWRYIDPSQFVPGWPLEAVAEHLQAVCDGEIRRLLINIPPRMSKSSLCSVAFPAWVWAQRNESPTSGPSVQFLTASYAQQLSLRDSVKCRRLIESPWYQRLWGERFKLTSDQNTKGRFENDRKGARLTTSVDSSTTGEGGSCFVAGTMVSTPLGQVPIEGLRDGDSVLAFDHQQGKVVNSRVTATSNRASNDIYCLHTFSGHFAVCTGSHAIYSPGRGYIRTDRLGPGDGVLIVGRAPALVSPYLRQMRGALQEKAVRGSQSSKTTQQRRLLLDDLFAGASCGKAPTHMRHVFQSVCTSAYRLLFHGMLAGKENSKTEAAQVSTLRNFISRLELLLLVSMRGRISCRAYAGVQELQVQRDWPLLQSIQGNARSDYGARSKEMRFMRERKLPHGANEWEDYGHTKRAPHQREYAGQQAGEFDYALREVPQETPLWKADHISQVSRDGSGTQLVYDIQVEGQSNFFANGILVHNCIIIDDPNAAQEAFSEATVQATKDWWDSTMSTRLNDQKTGAFIVIQQRLSEEDLSGHILSKDDGEWTHICLPMRYEPERAFVSSIGWQDPRTEAGELLWPERFGEKEVKSLERTLGPWATSGQLQQRPEPKGGGIIKRDWWQLWAETAYPPMDYILASLDTAYTTKTENDYSALTVLGVFTGDTVAQNVPIRRGMMDRTFSQQSPRVMLMGAWQERLELHQLVEKVAKSCRDMRVDKLIIENKASGISVAQELRRLFGHENWMVQLVDPKGQDKVARLYSVQHLFAEGMIYAPDRTWAEMVITQVGIFPKGKHDDLVDALAAGVRHLRDLGMLQRAPEMQAGIQESMQYTGKPPPPLYSA